MSRRNNPGTPVKDGGLTVARRIRHERPPCIGLCGQPVSKSSSAFESCW